MGGSRIFIIVQCRTGSTRLPGKALLPLAGRPLVERLLERLKAVRRIEGIVLATTRLPEDDDVAEIGRALRVHVVRGSSEDVLGRFAAAAKAVDAEIIVRVCADNPLTDPRTIELCLQQFLDQRLDYIHSFQEVEVPYGTGCAVFTRALLERAAAEATTSEDREHVEPWMLLADGVRRGPFCAPFELKRPEVHVSVDHLEDYLKVKRVFEACYRQNPRFDTAAVLAYLDGCPLIVCANGSLGLRLVTYLRERGEEIRGLVLHQPERARHRESILEAAGLCEDDLLSPESLRAPAALAWWRERSPELAVSLWSSYILPRDVIHSTPRGIVNLHNSLLPHARGSGANVWTILDRLPGGVTLHYLTEAVDRGPIIAQRAVPVASTDTGGTYFRRQEDVMVALFEEHWPRLRVGPVRATEQTGEGSFHRHGSQDRRRRIDLDRPTTARAVLDQLRAFTFPPYEGAWFEDEEGRRIAVEVRLTPVEVAHSEPRRDQKPKEFARV